MDFSYFTSAPQPYQFFGGMQHTPSTSQTPQLDDFRTAPSTVGILMHRILRWPDQAHRINTMPPLLHFSRVSTTTLPPFLRSHIPYPINLPQVMCDMIP